MRRQIVSSPMPFLGAWRTTFAPCYLAPPSPAERRRFTMAAPDPLYDLILLLDPAAPDEQRAKILADVQDAIGRDGEVVGTHDWGTRTMAYEIRHKADAEYHLLQFKATATLLAHLQRTLRITDGVVRFRIVKLAPGTPPPPEPRAERVEAPPAAAAQ
jgi:small subunit ribosomal protein S6